MTLLLSVIICPHLRKTSLTEVYPGAVRGGTGDEGETDTHISSLSSFTSLDHMPAASL